MNQPPAALTGCFGGIFGMLVAIGILYGDMRFMLFPLPIGIKARYIAIIYGLIAIAMLFGEQRMYAFAELGGAPTNAAGPALPPGAVPLETDAQGPLTVQLPPGAHALSVSVYGFDPFNTHFTLSGKHRQIVQIKLSTAPTSYVLAVGPDGRIQPISADLDAAIPLEPLATLVPLPARARRHGL